MLRELRVKGKQVLLSASTDLPPAVRRHASHREPLASEGCTRIGTSATAEIREACLEEVVWDPILEEVERSQRGRLQSQRLAREAGAQKGWDAMVMSQDGARGAMHRQLGMFRQQGMLQQQGMHWQRPSQKGSAAVLALLFRAKQDSSGRGS